MKMKNNFYAFAFLIGAIGFTSSCKKDVTAEPAKLDTTQKATIHGYVAADLNLTQLGNEPVANQAVVVSITYDQFDYLSDNTALKGNWSKTVTTDANGEFTVEVPTNTKGVNVKVAPIDFVYDQVQSFDAQIIESQKTISKYFSVAPKTITATAGEIKTDTWTYGATTPNTSDKYVILSGKVYAEVNSNAAGEDMLSGGTFTLYADGWSTDVTINSDGTYGPVLVPYNTAISATLTTTNNLGKVGGATSDVTKKYLYDIAVGKYTAYTNPLTDIHLGNGKSQEY